MLSVLPPSIYNVGDRLYMGQYLYLGGDPGGSGILWMLASKCLGILECLMYHIFPLNLEIGGSPQGGSELILLFVTERCDLSAIFTERAPS